MTSLNSLMLLAVLAVGGCSQVGAVLSEPIVTTTAEVCHDAPSRPVYYRPTPAPTKSPTAGEVVATTTTTKATTTTTTTTTPKATTTTATTTTTKATTTVPGATTSTTTTPKATTATTTPKATTTTPKATTTTLATTTTVAAELPYCACADKTKYADEKGKVTGGGWLYLTSSSYYRCNVLGLSSCPIRGMKSNFGFNAMFRKGVPMGSINFNTDGQTFHFQSEKGNVPHKDLEVLTDGVHARWMGRGSVATAKPSCGRRWNDGFCFMASVQDHGEPGNLDTFRLRVWDCTGTYLGSTCNLGDWEKKPLSDFTAIGDLESCLIFDTNYVPASNSTHTSYKTVFPLPGATIGEARFNGTEIGELGSAHGGGNIQIHIKNKPNKFLSWMKDSNIPCSACPPNATEMAASDRGFVTGGGWIILGTDAYYKPSGKCNVIPSDSTYRQEKCARKGGCGYQQDSIVADCLSTDVSGSKANYGFNAKHIKGIARGHFNFNFHNKTGSFHFQSMTMDNKFEYDCLEIVCDDKYGISMTDGAARFTGIGRMSRSTSLNPSASEWTSGYRYYVAVTDAGEPGYLDTLRLRVEDLSPAGSILFDTNFLLGPIFRNSDINKIECPFYNSKDGTAGKMLQDPMCDLASSTCQGDPEWSGVSLAQLFNGTQAGLNDLISKGGGNIQLHCKGGPES